MPTCSLLYSSPALPRVPHPMPWALTFKVPLLFPFTCTLMLLPKENFQEEKRSVRGLRNICHNNGPPPRCSPTSSPTSYFTVSTLPCASSPSHPTCGVHVAADHSTSEQDAAPRAANQPSHQTPRRGTRGCCSCWSSHCRPRVTPAKQRRGSPATVPPAP